MTIVIKKKARSWLILWFYNILDRISSFVYVNEKFCNKNLFLDLFNAVLIVFPDFILPTKCVLKQYYGIYCI